MPQPPTWRTRVSLLVWPIAFDPSGMGGPTSNKCYRRHGSQAHFDTQAPPLRQSSDTSGGGGGTFTSIPVYCFESRAARVCVSGLLLFTKMASKK
jgi:hypothetical protein